MSIIFYTNRSWAVGDYAYRMGLIRPLIWWFVLGFCLVACATQPSDSPTLDTREAPELELSVGQVETLSSLRQVDDYPLYTMHHYAPEAFVALPPKTDRPLVSISSAGGQQWACSLFAALGDPVSRVFGRNFDWEFSPALLLFNHPLDGFASVSMVDIAYLGFAGDDSEDLTQKPLDELVGLLDASWLPFDGMNEAGLVVGMAAVPEGYAPVDPGKETVDSLGIIRLVLDGAATVEQAVELMQGYNVDFEGQVPLHYLLADATGGAALVEYHAGQIRVIRTETDWHHATNFKLSAVDSTSGQCERYDTITEELDSSGGDLDSNGALSLLERVAQPTTQWSVVYNITSGELRVVMGQAYERVHLFSLEIYR